MTDDHRLQQVLADSRDSRREHCTVCGEAFTLRRGFIPTHADAGGTRCAGSHDVSSEYRTQNAAKLSGDALWARFED